MSNEWNTSQKLWDRIAKAVEVARKEGIKADSIIINPNVAKINGMMVFFGDSIIGIPPMVCGLEAFEAKELPNNIEFAVFETDKKKMDEVIAKAQELAIREMVSRLALVALISRKDGNYLGFKEADILSITASGLIDELPLKIKEVSE